MTKAMFKLSSLRIGSAVRRGKTPLRRFWSLALLAGLLSTTACNTHLRSERRPEFRGITVPLPPPSYRSAETVKAGFSGRWPALDAGRASLWDRRSESGVLAPIKKDGSFTFLPWALNLKRHCLELSVENYPMVPRTSPRLYALVIREGMQCAASVCSPQRDQEGRCLCVEETRNDCFSPAEPSPATTTDAVSGTSATATGASTSSSAASESSK